MTFEEKLKKLTQIVEQLEEGNALPLEDSLKLFEEGIGLISSCRQMLENAEQRVENILETDFLVVIRAFATLTFSFQFFS